MTNPLSRQAPCSVARALDLLGDGWTMLVLREAFYGVRRFDVLQHNLGIARNVLAARLERLVTEGVLHRVPYQDRPVRHEYRLTDKGRALFEVMMALVRFGDDWLSGTDGPPILFRDRETGEVVRPRVVDERTGQPLELRRLVPEAGPGFDPAAFDAFPGRFAPARGEGSRGA